MTRPKRLIYLSSGLQSNGNPELEGMESPKKSGIGAYSDSKLQDVMLAFGVARRWSGKGAGGGKAGVESIAFDPGWVKTKMGGMGAPEDAERPAEALARLATMEEVQTGKLYGVGGIKSPHQAAQDEGKQDQLLDICGRLSGVAFPM